MNSLFIVVAFGTFKKCKPCAWDLFFNYSIIVGLEIIPTIKIKFIGLNHRENIEMNIFKPCFTKQIKFYVKCICTHMYIQK